MFKYDNIRDMKILKMFPGGKIRYGSKDKFDFESLKNIFDEGEHAVNQHFFFFLQCFQKPLPSAFLKPWDCLAA